MKVQRYDAYAADRYCAVDYKECQDGLLCMNEDVARLEASHAELEAKCAELEDKCAELVCAAKDVIARWDSPLWRMEEHTADFINRLREAAAKCEGMP